MEIKVNGVMLHYVKKGAGKPVLLIHGNGGSWETFAVMIDQLAAAGYCVYAPDSRGHGLSQAVEVYHYADMAEDMHEMIAALGIEGTAVYGWSDGGIIALLLGRKYPSDVGAVIVSGANLTPDGVTKDLYDELRLRVMAGPDPLAELMWNEPDIAPETLGVIKVPALVTAGEFDLIRPEHTRLIADSLPKGELLIVKNEDHGSYIEGSPVMGDILLDFLKKHGY